MAKRSCTFGNRPAFRADRLWLLFSSLRPKKRLDRSVISAVQKTASARVEPVGCESTTEAMDHKQHLLQNSMAFKASTYEGLRFSCKFGTRKFRLCSFSVLPLDLAGLAGPTEILGRRSSGNTGVDEKKDTICLHWRLGAEIVSNFLHKLFEHPLGSGTSRQNCRTCRGQNSFSPGLWIWREEMSFQERGTPRKVFSTSTLSRGQPPPHGAVLGPKI